MGRRHLQKPNKYLDDTSGSPHAICSKSTHTEPDSNLTTADHQRLKTMWSFLVNLVEFHLISFNWDVMQV